MPDNQTSGETRTLYDILKLSKETLDDQDNQARRLTIKLAYRRALLQHHPDKAAASQAAEPPHTCHTGATRDTITVDQISTAFAVLSDPARRGEYDRSVERGAAPGRPTDVPPFFRTGVEDVDLDELASDETTAGGGGGENRDGRIGWYRGCRCGNARGYRLDEADLEDAAQYGHELMVGCVDCSLWLRVHFAVVDA